MTDGDPAGISVAPVTEWMAEHIGTSGPLTFERIAGGHSNLTYRVDDANGRTVVLRRPPLGKLLPTAHDMGREFKLISGMYPTAVPVPEPLGHCTDPDVIGAPFYVMAYVEGHVLHNIEAATLIDENARRSAGAHFVDVLAEMHAVDPDDVGLGDLARKEGYIERQLKRWYSQWNQSKTREFPLVDEVHDELLSRIPEQGPARVVHGDYRLGNCLTTDAGRIAAVLDWEIATLGDPLADMGYVMSQWSEPGEPPARLSPSGASGFPTRVEILERYAARSGRDLSQIDFYTAFSHWKSSCIVEGVYARYLAGALDTTGIDLDGFRLSVEHSVTHARQALDRL